MIYQFKEKEKQILDEFGIDYRKDYTDDDELRIIDILESAMIEEVTEDDDMTEKGVIIGDILNSMAEQYERNHSQNE